MDVIDRLGIEFGSEQRPVGCPSFFVIGAELAVEEMRGEAFVRLSQPVGAVARPAVLRRVGHHPRPHRVELDVALARQQIAFGLHHAGFVAPFPQAAGAPVEAVGVLDVAAPERLNQTRRGARFRRCQQQMDVIGHQGVGVDGAATSASRLFQPMEIAVVIFIGKKARLAVDAALNDVQRVVGEKDAGAAGHGYGLSSDNQMSLTPLVLLAQKIKCL